jgi:hypothetical protein
MDAGRNNETDVQQFYFLNLMRQMYEFGNDPFFGWKGRRVKSLSRRKQMKHEYVAITTVLVLLVGVSVGQQVTKKHQAIHEHPDLVVRIKNHVIGETEAEFVHIEPTSKDQLDSCHIPICQVVEKGGYTAWKFKDGRLVGMNTLFYGWYETARDDLTKRFGSKPHEIKTPRANVLGTKWNVTSAVWISESNLLGRLKSNENPAKQGAPSLSLSVALNGSFEDDIEKTYPLD